MGVARGRASKLEGMKFDDLDSSETAIDRIFHFGLQCLTTGSVPIERDGNSAR